MEKTNSGSAELTVSDGQSISVSGYPSPAGTHISAINGAKAPFAILAVGNLAISKGPVLNTNLSSNEKLAVHFY